MSTDPTENMRQHFQPDGQPERLDGGTAGASYAVAGGSGSTAFACLSPAAQEIIVNAVMGEYDRSGPPEMAESLKSEIAAWAQEDESPNTRASATPEKTYEKQNR